MCTPIFISELIITELKTILIYIKKLLLMLGVPNSQDRGSLKFKVLLKYLFQE
jgi:hypothetical protein